MNWSTQLENNFFHWSQKQPFLCVTVRSTKRLYKKKNLIDALCCNKLWQIDNSCCTLHTNMHTCNSLLCYCYEHIMHRRLDLSYSYERLIEEMWNWQSHSLCRCSRLPLNLYCEKNEISYLELECCLAKWVHYSDCLSRLHMMCILCDWVKERRE